MKPIQKPVRQEREKQAGKQPHFERKDRKSAVNSDIKSTQIGKSTRLNSSHVRTSRMPSSA